MDKNIPVLYREYGKYINSSRAFPLDLDGLKPVERKILLSTFMIARDKFVKSARISGHCMGNFSAHSDAYPTIVQLVNQGFLDGQGNFGANFGVEPVGAASSRYTETKLSKLTKELAFRLIEYVPWEVNELSQEEPLFLPTMFPMCLLTKEYVQGIGFGYRTIIPCYKIDDLYRRLLYLLGKEKDKPTIRPISDCQILSSDDKLEELLTIGKSSIEFKGIMEVDKLNYNITIKSWPNGKKFETILGKLEKELDNQDIGFTDLSTTETSVVFEVLKQRNKDEILNRVVKKLEDALIGSVSFEIITADENKDVRITSIDELLLKTYHMYKNINEIMLKNEIKKFEDSIVELNILKKIKPFISKYLNLAITFSEAIKKISKESLVEESIVKDVIQKYKISKLLNIDTDITSLKEEIEKLNNILKEIDIFILNQYKKIGE